MTPLAPVENPYRGLAPYAEEDAPFFFGRGADIRHLVASLEARRLTVLYGPSGVGKSSLLLAGVVRALRGRARRNVEVGGQPELAVVVARSWRDDPVAAVSAAARRAVAEIDDAPAAAMREEPLPLVDVLEEASRRVGELFVVFDQFEEYFVYHEDNDEFPRELAEAVRREDRVRGSFLIALREDALAKLDRLQGHMPGLYDGLVRVDHLSSADARDAIVGPLDEYNRRNAGADAPLVAIEPDLVAEIVAQVEGDRAGGLAADASRIEAPILQLVMTRLWNAAVETGSSVLELDTFHRLGGAARIATAHVGDALAKLDSREQAIAATVFAFLVTRSGTKIAHSTADLADYAEIPEHEVAMVLEKLAAERIVRAVQPEPGGSDVTRYEIFHDILASSILDWRTRHGEQQRLRAERERIQAEFARTSRERQLEKRLRFALASLAVLAFVVVVLVAVVAAR